MIRTVAHNIASERPARSLLCGGSQVSQSERAFRRRQRRRGPDPL